MRKAFSLVFAVSLIVVGCGGGTENAPTEVQATPDSEARAAAGQASSGMMGGLNTEIRLDPEIAEAWAGIRVRVVGPDSEEGQIIDIPIGETKALGDSGLTLKAELFIPDFVMDERGISSRSSETHNPAARVVISEEGAADYEGWLFAAMPEIHPFPHESFQVLLIEGIPSE
jgi:hypothetical protein